MTPLGKDASLTERATTFILFAVALLGLAHIAFLPPFEGFDETAHLSYIEQIADTGTLPRLGRDQISTDVENYSGPLTEGLKPPSERTYHGFLANNQSLPRAAQHRYEAGHSSNWEAQHPPLYYLALAPFYKAAQDWDWKSLFLMLRAVSWAMAFAGFTIGARTTLHALHDAPPLAAFVVAGWPLLLPEFFPEMARLGNDSLCLLFMGIAWWWLLRLLAHRDLRSTLGLGLTLALGLWTKAFFIPITAGIVLFFVFIALRDRDFRLLRYTLLTSVVASVGGCGWYVYEFLSTGDFAFMQADKAPDFWITLPQAFDLNIFLRGLYATASSFVWSGTWSFTTFSPIYNRPILIFLGLMLLGWLMRLRNRDDALIAPAFIVVPMMLGLVAHWLTQMTLFSAGNETPGGYLHILSGPLSFALASGWRWPKLLGALGVYALIFHAACWLEQISVFSGCTYKVPGNKYLQVGDCFISPVHLGVVGSPMLGAAAFFGALIAIFCSFHSYRIGLRTSS